VVYYYVINSSAVKRESDRTAVDDVAAADGTLASGKHQSVSTFDLAAFIKKPGCVYFEGYTNHDNYKMD